MRTIDTVWQAETQQAMFRALLSCMSLPGEIADLSPYLGTSPALTGVLATLLDGTVSFSDEEGLVSKNERHLLQAPTAAPETANFVVKSAVNPPQNSFLPNLGELPSPEKGATLILQGEALGVGNLILQLSGAGVKGTRLVSMTGFNSNWFVRRQQWVENFPLGTDIILVDSTCVMALPRTTKIVFG